MKNSIYPASYLISVHCSILYFCLLRHIDLLNWTVYLSTFKNMTSCYKIPWLFPDFFQNFIFPWLNSKFPDFSLTLNFFHFSLTFPWPWEPCLSYQTRKKNPLVYEGLKTGSETLWVMTCDFHQCGILISVGSGEHVQPLFKLGNTKYGSVSSLTLSLTLIKYSSG